MTDLKFKKNISLLFTSSLIILSTAVSLAGPGGVSGGGEYDRKTGQVLDIAEFANGSGSITFSPSSYKQVKNILNLWIGQVQNADVSFAKLLKRNIFPDEVHIEENKFPKVWYLRNAPINDAKVTQDLHILLDSDLGDEIPNRYQNIPASIQVVAIQNNDKIEVYKPWLDERLKLAEKSYDEYYKIAALFMHEGIMEIVMQLGLNHDVVRELNRIIMADYLGGSFPSAQFVQILKLKGFFPAIYQDKVDQSYFMQLQVSEVMSIIDQPSSSDYIEKMNYLYDLYSIGNNDGFDAKIFNVYLRLASIMNDRKQRKERISLEYKAQLDNLMKELIVYPEKFK